MRSASPPMRNSNPTPMYPLDTNLVPPTPLGTAAPRPVPPPLPPSPAEEARAIEAHAGRFYVIDSSRVTMRESANVTKSPFVLLIVFVMKLFRIPIPSSMDDPNVESLRPFEVTEASLPPEEQAALQPMLAELGALGFGAPIFYALWDRYPAPQIYLASLSHPTARAVARVHHRIWHVRHPPRVQL